MRVLIIILSFFLMGSTYYVNPNSGTECDGDGCSVNHLYWLHPVKGNTSLLKEGDTVHVASGEYEMGLNGPNDRKGTCDKSWPWSCYMNRIPKGVQIIGDCANPPVFWGAERADYIFNLNGSSDVTLKCLDITDKADCIEFQTCNRGTFPYGKWADVGVDVRNTSNVVIDTIDIHGLSLYGLVMGNTSNLTVVDSKIRMNGWGGVDSRGSNSGDIKFIRTDIEYNGCSENEHGQPNKCWGQQQGGYGDGLGSKKTKGNWYFEDTNFLHNTSDGLDLLYADTEGSVEIKGGTFEGNAGNQIKSGFQTTIQGARIVGNCDYFSDKTLTWTGWGDDCRALGQTIALAVKRPDQYFEIRDVTMTQGHGDTILLTSGSCDGTQKLNIFDSTFEGGVDYHQPFENTAWHWGCIKDINYSNVNVTGVKGGCPEGATCSSPTPIEPTSDDPPIVEVPSDPPVSELIEESTCPVCEECIIPDTSECTIPSPKRITATQFRNGLKKCYERALLGDPCEIFHNTYRETFILQKL